MGLLVCPLLWAGDWGSWSQVPGAPGVQSRARCRDFNQFSGGYEWDLEFKNTYLNKNAKVRVFFYRKNKTTGKWELETKGGALIELSPGTTDRTWCSFPRDDHVEFSTTVELN